MQNISCSGWWWKPASCAGLAWHQNGDRYRLARTPVNANEECGGLRRGWALPMQKNLQQQISVSPPRLGRWLFREVSNNPTFSAAQATSVDSCRCRPRWRGWRGSLGRQQCEAESYPWGKPGWWQGMFIHDRAHREIEIGWNSWSTFTTTKSERSHSPETSD